MTELLEKAFAEAAKLPIPEQDELAAWILEELADEERWQRSFSESRDVLRRLAAEALEELHSGQTVELRDGGL